MPWAILFDMDGVLVDASRSYRRAIVETVACYLRVVLGLPDPPGVVSAGVIHALKLAGGFNNDWDLTRALLRGICRWERAPASGQAAVAEADLPGYVQRLAAAGGGPEAVERVCGEIGRARVRGDGAVTGENLVERIFQERYLGPALFTRLYGEAPRFVARPGLIDNESPIVPPADVRALARRYPVALVTGRARPEAAHTLEALGLEETFRVRVTHDAILAAQAAGIGARLGKPHPWSLLRALERLDHPGPFLYVGDTPDDMRAAAAAGAVMGVEARGIGLCAPSDAQALRQAGAQALIHEGSDLRALVEAL